jgi:hypothetical protein
MSPAVVKAQELFRKDCIAVNAVLERMLIINRTEA